MTEEVHIRWALIKDGEVYNVVNWDGDVKTWMPPEEFDIIEVLDDENVAIGMLYGEDGFFHKPVDLNVVKSNIIRSINEEAGSRILAIAPEYKQRNLLARATYLTGNHGARKDWSAEAITSFGDEWAAGEVIWATIEAVRQASNVAVQEIRESSTESEVKAVSVNWPE